MRWRWLLTAGAVVAASIPASPAGATNDALFKAQWNLTAVHATQAWATSTGKGTTIGVVDTGADLLHEDLATKIVASTSCVGANGNESKCSGMGQDDNGHGTHVAGIAAAATGNGRGIAGMAPDAKLVVAKAVNSQESAAIPDIVAGIHWVVDHGAKVVLLGFGDSDFTVSSVLGASLHDAIEYAWSKGAVPVMAAGNPELLGFGLADYGNTDVMVVDATGVDGSVTGYSDSAPTGSAKWALLAPGGSADGTPADDVLSTFWAKDTPNAYQALAGTSQAAALVAGTVALLLAAGYTPATAVARILSTVAPLACGAQSLNCKGVLNAGAALTSPKPPPTTLATTPTTFVSPSTTVAQPVPTITVAPPAVMNPTHPPPPVTTAPPRSNRPPTTTPGHPSATTLPGNNAVAVSPLPPRSPGGGGSTVVWFVVLALLFVGAAGGGVFWFFRTSPDPE